MQDEEYSANVGAVGAVDQYSIFTIGSGSGTTYSSSAVNTSGMFTNSIWNSQQPMLVQPGGKIKLNGEEADIEFNGQSLMETLKAIEQRLDVLRPDPRLEAEWDQLRELGEQYRRLETELREKQAMWDTLKKMPPKPEAP
jgi:hypothetical protein